MVNIIQKLMEAITVRIVLLGALISGAAGCSAIPRKAGWSDVEILDGLGFRASTALY